MNGTQKTNNDIAAIPKTIDEIAFQTNVLALIAAVRRRAGEGGAGFAVVAEEVRVLAQRSARAAQETADKMATAPKSNTRGAELGRSVEKGFHDIAEVTRSYAAMVQEVEHASQQSTPRLGQIREALDRLGQITQRTAAAAEENASASEEMNAQMDKIFDYVRALEKMVVEAAAKPPGARSARTEAALAPRPVPATTPAEARETAVHS